MKKIKIFGMYEVILNQYTCWIRSPFGIRVCGIRNGAAVGTLQAVSIAQAALDILTKEV